MQSKTEEFEKWLAEAVTIRAAKTRKDPHDVFQHVEMLAAKLSFMDGDSPEDFSKEIKLS